MRRFGGRSGSVRSVATWLGVNVVFGVCHPALTDVLLTLPPFGRSLVVNAVLFLLPAIAWGQVFHPASRRLGTGLSSTLIVSSGVFLGSLFVMRGLGLAATGNAAWATLWVLSNVGFACAAIWARSRVPRQSFLRPEVILGVGCFLVAYCLFFWGATRVVPPQEDQDLEVAGTAFGLLTRFEPLLLTDRHSVYFFAHPPLLHFYVGGAYLFHGALSELRFYDEASARVRDAWEGRPATLPPGPVTVTGHPRALPVEPGQYDVVASLEADYLLAGSDGGQVRVSVESVELDRIYARYSAHPFALYSRTPNIFFAACTVALLAVWAGRISRHWWVGVLAAAAYATLPEVFVRSSYGGYFAAGGLIAILILMAAQRRPWLPMVLGAMAALLDHKLVLLPAAIGLYHVLRTGRIHPVVTGFVVGTAIFWAWGLAIAPTAFVADHLRGHLVDRLLHHNPLGYTGYLSPAGLWLEFLRHTGWVLLPAGITLLIADISSVSAKRKPPFAPERGVWLLWIVATAAAFTVVDWRMTKHIMPLALPLMLALVPGRDAPRWRVAVPVAAFLVILIVNAGDLVTLARDFSAFRATPVW